MGNDDGVDDAMYDRDRDGVTCRGPTRGPGHSAGAELYSHATIRDATGSVSLLCTCTLACMHAPPDVIAHARHVAGGSMIAFRRSAGDGNQLRSGLARLQF